MIGQGAIKMVTKKDSVSIPASVLDMKRIMVSVLDYIRGWENNNFFGGSSGRF